MTFTEADYKKLATFFAAKASETPPTTILAYDNPLLYDNLKKQKLDPRQTPTNLPENKDERVAQAKFWGSYFVSQYENVNTWNFDLSMVPRVEDVSSYPGWRLITERTKEMNTWQNIQKGLVYVYSTGNSTTFSCDIESVKAIPQRSPCLEADVVFHEFVHRIWYLKFGENEQESETKQLGIEEAVCDYFAVLLSKSLKESAGNIRKEFHNCVGVLHAYYWRDARGHYVNKILRTCEERSRDCEFVKGKGLVIDEAKVDRTNTDEFYAKRNYDKRLNKSMTNVWRDEDEHCHGHIFADMLFLARNKLISDNRKILFDRAVWTFFMDEQIYGGKQVYEKDTHITTKKLMKHIVDSLDSDVAEPGTIEEIFRDAAVEAGATPDFVRPTSLRLSPKTILG